MCAYTSLTEIPAWSLTLLLTCSLASISLSLFEPPPFPRLSLGQQEHKAKEHNMWQYVWLKIYLRDKDPVDYQGVELHVAPSLLANSPKCMPIKRARAIQGNVKDKATLPTLLRITKAIRNKEDTFDKVILRRENAWRGSICTRAHTHDGAITFKQVPILAFAHAQMKQPTSC